MICWGLPTRIGPPGPGALFVHVTGNFAREVSARRVLAEIGAVMGVELIKGSLGVLRHMDMRRNGDLQRACVVSSFSVTLPIGGDLADEVGRRLGDVREYDRQAELARPVRALGLPPTPSQIDNLPAGRGEI